MKKKQIEENVKKRHQLKAKKLLLNEDYIKALKKYKTTNGRLAKTLRKGAIEHKYSTAPYDVNILKEVANGDRLLVEEFTKIVNVIQKDEKGYVHLKIKLDEPHFIIRHFIDSILKAYGIKKGNEEKKKRFRETTYDPFEIWCKVKNEKKTLYQITKELTGINKPSSCRDKKIFMAKYQALKREFDKAEKEINKTKK